MNNLFTYTKNHQGIENWIFVKVIETNETFPFDRGDQNEEQLATMLNGFIKTRGYREE